MERNFLQKLLLKYRGRFEDLPADAKLVILGKLSPDDLHRVIKVDKHTRGLLRDVRTDFTAKTLFEKQVHYNQFTFHPLPKQESEDNIESMKTKLREWFPIRVNKIDNMDGNEVCKVWYILRYLKMRKEIMDRMEPTLEAMDEFRQGFRMVYRDFPDESFTLSKLNCSDFITSTLEIANGSRLNLELQQHEYDTYNAQQHIHMTPIERGTLYWDVISGDGDYYHIHRSVDFKHSYVGLRRLIHDGEMLQRRNDMHTVNPVNIFLLGCNLFHAGTIEMFEAVDPDGVPVTGDVEAETDNLEIGNFHQWPTEIGPSIQNDREVSDFFSAL